MIYFFIYAVLSYIFMCVLYSSYVLVMEAIKHWGRDSYRVKTLALLFLLFDTFCNLFIVSIWSIDPPREFTVTARLKRWKQYQHKGWYTLNKIQQYRLIFAIWLCDTKLDRDDYLTGNHC